MRSIYRNFLLEVMKDGTLSAGEFLKVVEKSVRSEGTVGLYGSWWSREWPGRISQIVSGIMLDHLFLNWPNLDFA